MTDYALYMLDPNGVITSWNAGGQRIKGYTPERSSASISRASTPRPTAPRRAAPALRPRRSKAATRRKAGGCARTAPFFWASVVIDPIRDEDGELIGFAKITRDITERREAQLELERAAEAACQSQKLEALGQLTGGVAHDFNNLLMIVSGSLHTLKKGIGNERQAEARGNRHRNRHQAGRLAHQPAPDLCPAPDRLPAGHRHRRADQRRS